MKADDLPINTPCDESWSAMRGGPSRRFCDVCARDVHDLSQMTERDARTLLAGAGARLCVRYAIGHDGAIRFKPEAPLAAAAPANLVQLRTPTRDRPAAALARAAAAAALLAACTPHARDEEPPPCSESELVQEVVQGGVEGIMAPPPPPPPPPIVQGVSPGLEPPPPPPPPPVVDDPPAVMGEVAEVKMGDIAGPAIDPPPPPPPAPERVKMGKIAYDPGLERDPIEEVPCESTPPAPPPPSQGPRRY